MSYMRERVNNREETKRVSFYFSPFACFACLLEQQHQLEQLQETTTTSRDYSQSILNTQMNGQVTSGTKNFSLSLLYQHPNRLNNIENFQRIKFTRISLSFLRYHCCQTSFSSASI